MGGSYYDREIEIVNTINTANTTSYSTKADVLFQQNQTLHPSLNPNGRNLSTLVKNPIICAVDVTGSMGNWAKTIWDKLPMFYGQLISQGYVKEPSISFVGVGDAHTDKAPLQVSDFRQGTTLDNEIQKLWLEGGGGGQHYESYELCAYYFAHHCVTPNIEQGFFFFMGDEGYYPKVKASQIRSVIGDQIPEDIDSTTVYATLRNKFHVFFIHKPYWDKEIDKKQLIKWKAVVGEDRILELTEPKSIVDIMLGAIAIVGRSRTLDEYIKDITDRGQTEQRISDVMRCLKVIMAHLDNPTFAPPGISDDEPYGMSSVTTTTTTTTTTTQIEWPAEFKCPITEEVFVDPVIAKDGHTYEKAAIQGWLKQNNSSPITGEAISTTDLIPNITLKNAIAQFRNKFI